MLIERKVKNPRTCEDITTTLGEHRYIVISAASLCTLHGTHATEKEALDKASLFCVKDTEDYVVLTIDSIIRPKIFDAVDAEKINIDD